MFQTITDFCFTQISEFLRVSLEMLLHDPTIGNMTFNFIVNNFLKNSLLYPQETNIMENTELTLPKFEHS